MNWRHFRAFVWLRWRLLRNQWRRGGTLNAVLMSIVLVGALATAVPLFIGCFLLGLYAIPRAQPVHLMYAWDGLVAAFLFFWGIGLVTELQKTEPLSLSKFLHLPVSVDGAFLINYLSSLTRLSLIVFGPLMFGYALALVVVKGAWMLPVLPLLAAFLLMVTALTYQFQGWLASLMNNPRRRRTIVVATTASLLLLSQLPNLVNFFTPWGAHHWTDRSRGLAEGMAKLDLAAQAKEFDAVEHLRRQQELIEKHQLDARQADREFADRWADAARLANMVLPVGWLPLGVMSAAERNLIPSILGLFGMTLIGTTSLWRAYRTTLGQYQGQATNRTVQPARTPARAATPPEGRRKTTVLLLEARLPGLSEPVSAVALGGFRSLVRSPEAKMMLLTPLLMSVIFGSMLLKGTPGTSESMRPFVAIGAMAFVLFGLLQLAGNQFGFDRDGFRVFVLSPASRRDILLGKNMAFAPLALGMAAILLPIVQVLCPMRLDHLLAMVPQYVSMFLLFCVFTNLLSILAPLHIAAGSLRPANPPVSTVLLQLAMVTVLFPLLQGATLLPLGIEAVLNLLGWYENLPIYLLLSLAECAAIVLIYYVSLAWQGSLFQSREQRILEIVTNRAS